MRPGRSIADDFEELVNARFSKLMSPTLWGTVTTMNPVTVTLSGATTPVTPRLFANDVQTEVGDVVGLVRIGTQWAMTEVLTTTPPDVWHYIGEPGEPPFLNGWQNLSATLGVPLASAAFRRVGPLIEVGGYASGASASSAVMWEMPPEYVPATISQYFAVRSLDLALPTGQMLGCLPDGNFACLLPQSTPVLAVLLSGRYQLHPPESL